MHRPAAAALALSLIVGSAGVAWATPNASQNRMAGPDRFVTARIIATSTFGQSTIATLVSGRTFPDALASAYLNGATSSPLLLTHPDRLPAGLVDTMRDLQVRGVQVIGGTTAVSDAVLDDLRAQGFTVNRVAGGNDRYETARKVAELLPAETIGDFGAGRAAIVASGETFADALTAGPMSASQALPILLTQPQSLNVHARAVLLEMEIRQVLIVGGSAAVSRAVLDEIAAMGIAVRRIAGATRQATAQEVARVAQGELGFPIDRVLLARGDEFADALAGGVRGGELQAPILLTQSVDSLGTPATTFIANNSDTVQVVDVLGGTAAVSDRVVNEAIAAARG